MKKILSFYPIIIIALLIASCGAENNSKSTEIITEDVNNDEDTLHPVVEKGTEIAMGIRKALGSNLMAALEKEGVAGAVKFCNIKGLPITDSVAANMGVVAQRLSHKPRNPANAALGEDLTIIAKFLELAENDAEIKPIFYEEEDHFIYYQPIMVDAPFCLQCHGKPGDDIVPEDFITINLLYPEDKAHGFSFMDLRGTWKISIPKSNFPQL